MHKNEQKAKNLYIQGRINEKNGIWVTWYYTAHNNWEVTTNQGLFYLWNKSFWYQLLRGILLVKTSGCKVFIIRSSHFYLQNWDNF